MRKMIIASHSQLAEGFKKTLDFLTGGDDRIIALCAYTDRRTEDIRPIIEELLNYEDEFIVLTDMAGGSVNQRFFPHMSDRVHVISGINLPLAISIAVQLDSPHIDIPQLVAEARQQLIYVNDQIIQKETSDE